MKSAEQINKIRAVVLYILQHFTDGIDYIKLFKIMYFAQREYLATYGLTIAEDTFKARQLGPAPSLTYKVVKLVEGGEDSADLKGFTSSIRVDENKKIYATATLIDIARAGGASDAMIDHIRQVQIIKEALAC